MPGSSHRRTGLNLLTSHGHNRRHSLGLNEAIRAAATQRESNNRNTLLPPMPNDSNPTSFKFPATADSPTGLAAEFLQTSISSSTPPPLNQGPSGSSGSSSHSRSRSLAYGQPLFKFPPENPGNSASLLPPTPAFETYSPERGSSGHNRKGLHYRLNLRNFDSNSNINQNWRHQQKPSSTSNGLEPPPGFSPGHRTNHSASYHHHAAGSTLLLSNFLPNNGNGGGNSNGRKLLFAPYLPQLPLPDLIADGRLVTGTLRVNKKNRSDAYVATDGLLDADIFICGSKDRNRALEGDLVAVELLVVDEVWELKKEKEEKKRRKDNTFKAGINDDIHNDATSATTASNSSSPQTGDQEGDTEAGSSLARRGSLKKRPTMKKNDDVEVEGQSLLLVEEEEINDDVKPLYAGHVVAVVDRIPGQLFSGTLGLLRPAQAAQIAKDKKNGKELNIQTPKSPKIVWFKPTDKKVPLIAIPTEQAPRDFVENHEKYLDQLFVASIKRWPITSLHPFGTLVNRLGAIDDPETEIDLILRDNNFGGDEYEEDSFVSELPSKAAIDEELNSSSRVEYLSEYVISFTQNGEFVDHAAHVKRLLNTRIELGFHVVDISFNLRPGSQLDRQATKISSSVFLPQRLSPLFPEAVSNLILFKEGEKSLAVSVVFAIDTNTFEVEDFFIQESVIVPKQTVSYSGFDTILNYETSSKEVEALNISSATCDYVRTLLLIAREFRRLRLENSKLGITPSLPLLEQLDDEKVRLDLNIFNESTASVIINELSYKVNAAVASKIHAGLGDSAVLRRQSLPTLQKLEVFARKAKNLGVPVDTTSSSTLLNSILSIEDPIKRQCVEILLYKCMPKPKYYVAGRQDASSYAHYYLNLPLFTHFNAPLRRYIDLVVHRQLKNVVAPNTLNIELPDVDVLKATADYCNFKKECASSAQLQAVHLLLSQTIDGLSDSAGHILCMGTVLQVYESSFDVVIPEFGIEKRVHGDQLPLAKAEFDKQDRVLELYWEAGVDLATYVPPDEKLLLLYRSLIKNKHRTLSVKAAVLQNLNQTATQQIESRLSKYNLTLPKLQVSDPLCSGDSGALDAYLKNVITREEKGQYIQEIRELKQVPVLLRAEIGMALPCLTVKVLNPFA